jgi:hypothetical protein
MAKQPTSATAADNQADRVPSPFSRIRTLSAATASPSAANHAEHSAISQLEVSMGDLRAKLRSVERASTGETLQVLKEIEAAIFGDDSEPSLTRAAPTAL